MNCNDGQNMTLLQGYDNRSTLYDAGDYVLRKISPDYFVAIEDIYEIFKNKQLEQYGIVGTEIDRKSLSLRHKKHVISYPYEWTANMYKDAVLFHLQLFAELDRHGLTLKDALPGNIVFNNTSPVFVDFPSLVRKEKLCNEEWLLEGLHYSDVRYALVDRMLTPHILIPFMAMVAKKYDQARVLLSEKACNCGTPSWMDLDNGIITTLSIVDALKSFLNFISPILPKNSRQIITLRNILDLAGVGDFTDFTNRILEFVTAMDVTPPRSGYLSYYEDKKEKFDFDEQSAWNNKQINVYNIVNSHKPVTVLDIGANTGWFSILSEKLGAHVVALDIDESSIDSLYLYSKENKLNILPLLMPFDGLTKEIYGIDDKLPMYQGRDFKKTPLFLPATRRLKSEIVLCLGLLHHLILGMGKTIDEVLRILSDVTESILVLEYVDLEDEMIRSEPSFFKNLEKGKQCYQADNVLEAGNKYFDKIEIFPSHPETRKLFVFQK